MVGEKVEKALGRTIGCNYYGPNTVGKFHVQPGSRFCKKAGIPDQQIPERRIAEICLQLQCETLAIALMQNGLHFKDIPPEIIQRGTVSKVAPRYATLT